MTKDMPGWPRLILKALFRLVAAFLFIWAFDHWVLSKLRLREPWPIEQVLLYSIGVAWVVPIMERLSRKLEKRSGWFKRYKTLIYLALIVLVILLVEWISRGGF